MCGLEQQQQKTDTVRKFWSLQLLAAAMAYVDTGARFLELRIKSSLFLLKLQTGFTKSRCILYASITL